MVAAAEHKIKLDRDVYVAGDPPVVVTIMEGRKVLDPIELDVTPSLGDVMVLPSPREGAPGRLVWILPKTLDNQSEASLRVAWNGQTAEAHLVLATERPSHRELEWSAGLGYITNFGKVGAPSVSIGARRTMTDTMRLDLCAGFYTDRTRVQSELDPTDVESTQLRNTVVPVRLAFLYEWNLARFQVSVGPHVGLAWVSSETQSALTGIQRGSHLTPSVGALADASTEVGWIPGTVFLQTGWAFTPGRYDFARGNVGGFSLTFGYRFGWPP